MDEAYVARCINEGMSISVVRSNEWTWPRASELAQRFGCGIAFDNERLVFIPDRHQLADPQSTQ
jgi:hypothetical protein